jgi:hypothetical protein
MNAMNLVKMRVRYLEIVKAELSSSSAFTKLMCREANALGVPLRYKVPLFLAVIPAWF